MSNLLTRVLDLFKNDKPSIVPDPQQLNVVRWVVEGKGSLQLLARAGCGKTFTLMLVTRAIALCNLGDVALMAYNKKIADELKAKLNALKLDWKVALAGTVHSFGFSAWRKIAEGVKVEEKKVEQIIAQEALRPGGEIYLRCGNAIEKLVGFAKQHAVGHLCSIEDDAKWLALWDHHGVEDDVSEDQDPYPVVKAAQVVYRISLNMCRDVIDFDDMILAPLYFKARFWKRKWVLVDESQDTNPARRALALAMLDPRQGRMIFVGDDCQAIYGFTGADSDAMDQLKKATGAITLPLNVTRRCPQVVVREAQKLVPDITAHPEKEEGVHRSLDYTLLEKENLGKHDAILCRNTAPLVQTAYSLLAKGVACHVEGRQIGRGLIKLARRWKIKTLDQLMNKLDDYEARQTAKFKSKGQDARIDALIDQLDCLRVIINRCLVQKRPMIDDLVTDIEQMFGDTPDGEAPKVLTLSTVHKSKGREWERVYILGRSRFMPSPYARKDWQLQQERNLEYVAVTRALKELIDVPMPA